MSHDQAKTRVKLIFSSEKFQDGCSKSRINSAVLSEARQLVVEFDGRLPGRFSNGGLIMRPRKCDQTKFQLTETAKKFTIKAKLWNKLC